MIAAEGWFVAGASMYMAAGGGHALLTLVDTVRPTWFMPIDATVKADMERTGMRFRQPFPGDDSRPSLWSFWLGFNASHGFGVFAFGLFCLLIALHDFTLVDRIGAIHPLTIAVSVGYFAIALRYWFNAIWLLTGAATVCFVVAAVLA